MNFVSLPSYRCKSVQEFVQTAIAVYKNINNNYDCPPGSVDIPQIRKRDKEKSIQ